ncbi:IS66 family transposase [Dankookia rubra]|uniref:IS66 family transposase n=1 Tax=Dankookia rubra TaxID=1442381 RepID=A0A4R5Q634_9PROT|nr:IS66 family transposase [Dankookia rubra]TDH57888.1 IS66 family transposase [Dankookia rubra]
MSNAATTPPEDVAALQAALQAATTRALQVEAELANARARAADDQALIAHQQLQIAKLQHQLYGQRSERAVQLLDQLALGFDELASSATEDEIAAEQAAARTTQVAPFTRRRPARQPFPEHLPRERVVEPAPTACLCCGSARLRKLGEDITETLEVIPRSWKVIQHVREKFSCRACEKVSQAPAPFHVTPRGWAGPSLLAMVMFEKFGQHQPLNRQAERYAREGVPLSLSTLADQVGACCAALAPLSRCLDAHVLAAERLHGDDTTVPVLASGKTDVGRCWVYVRDDRPFGGTAAPAATFRYSRDRGGVHPQEHLASYAGLLQADAYSGYGKLYDTARQPGPILEAACWVHARRPFFVLADVTQNAHRVAEGKSAGVISPIALEAVRRIDALFEIERGINRHSAEQRRAVRQAVSAPLVVEFEAWMREQRARLSRTHDLARAMDYMLKRWPAFTRFLDDGRVCLSNNAAERALRGIALGRKSWLFAGSDRGGQRAAAMYSLIVTAKLNDADPQAWLADVLGRIATHPASRVVELLPWNWQASRQPNSKAA